MTLPTSWQVPQSGACRYLKKENPELTKDVGSGFFMRRPVQQKLAAKAAHGPRGE